MKASKHTEQSADRQPNAKSHHVVNDLCFKNIIIITTIIIISIAIIIIPTTSKKAFESVGFPKTIEISTNN